jgi:hypothetical protein
MIRFCGSSEQRKTKKVSFTWLPERVSQSCCFRSTNCTNSGLRLGTACAHAVETGCSSSVPAFTVVQRHDTVTGTGMLIQCKNKSKGNRGNQQKGGRPKTNWATIVGAAVSTLSPVQARSTVKTHYRSKNCREAILFVTHFARKQEHSRLDLSSCPLSLCASC